MKATIDRKAFLAVYGGVAAAAPTRSPKAILCSVLLEVSDDGSFLTATDLEVQVRCRVPGVQTRQPGSAVLPKEIGRILQSSADDTMDLTVEDDRLTVRGEHSEFSLPLEDAALFPVAGPIEGGRSCEVDATSLRAAIRRTHYAADTESSRYALGGALLECDESAMALVATDGRRLARQSIAADAINLDAVVVAPPVVPLKALKLLDKVLADTEGPVLVTWEAAGAMVRADGVEVRTRLVEGRFPRYQDVFPAEGSIRARIAMEAGRLRAATDQAAIVTSVESRTVVFRFEAGMLRLAAESAHVGSSNVELPIDHDGDSIEMSFDPRYLTEGLKPLEDDAIVTVGLIDGKNAAVLLTEDGFSYVVMPMTKDK